MDGKPLLESLRETKQVETIESWETSTGAHPDGMHSGSAAMSKEEAAAIIDQFVALGYIDPPDKDADKAVAQTNRENRWNLARSYLYAGLIDKAIPELERLVDEAPERIDFMVTLANCLQYCGLIPEAEALITYAMPDDSNSEAVLHTRAEVARARGDTAKALEHLQKLAALDQEVRACGGAMTAGRYLTLGATYAKLRRWDEAIGYYRKGLETDPELARAHLGIAHCLLRLHRYDDAVDSAMAPSSWSTISAGRTSCWRWRCPLRTHRAHDRRRYHGACATCRCTIDRIACWRRRTRRSAGTSSRRNSIASRRSRSQLSAKTA